MLKGRCILGLAVLMTLARWSWAGESGLNVIVVVNQNSSNSIQLGNDYCERRGVPPQNLFRMTGWTGGPIIWQQGDFEDDLLNPLLAMISGRGLTKQAEIVLLSMDIPYTMNPATARARTAPPRRSFMDSKPTRPHRRTCR